MKRVSFNFIYDRKKTATTKKAASLEIRFTMGSKQKYVSTGIKLLKGEWRCGRVVKRDDRDFLNDLLISYHKRAEKVVLQMSADETLSLNDIPNLLDGKDRNSMDFIAYCEKRSEERDVCEHTRVRYRVFCRFLRKWGKIRKWSDVTTVAIRNMNEYLHRKGLKEATIYNYNKYLKLFIRDAVMDKFLQGNPYDTYNNKIPRGESLYVRCLSLQEFAALKRLNISSPHLKRAWHLFLFQCYTAMSYSDMMEFDIRQCKKDGNGNLCYTDNRVKTNVEFTFQLLTPAREILDYYGGVLPKMSLQKYNDYLKPIGMMIGVEGLRSHMGRATAATIFLSKGMPLHIVSKVLGHRSIRQTQRYARTLDDDVMKNFSKIDNTF